MRRLEPTMSVINSRAARKWCILLYPLLCTAVHTATRLLRPKTPPSVQSLHMTSLRQQLGHGATLNARRRAQTSGAPDDVTISPSMHPNAYTTASPSGSLSATPGQSPRLTSAPSHVPLAATPPPTAPPPIAESTPASSAHPTFTETASPSLGQDAQSGRNGASHAPSLDPEQAPSSAPSVGSISTIPNSWPSSKPSTEPSLRPSAAEDTELPSLRSTPYLTDMPSEDPRSGTTHHSSDAPSAAETARPTAFPSIQVTLDPRLRPTRADTEVPSAKPRTAASTMQPSGSLTLDPINDRSNTSSFNVIAEPTSSPSTLPSSEPRLRPSLAETTLPSSTPSMLAQGSQPAGAPTLDPNYASSSAPTVGVVAKPTNWSSKVWSTEQSSSPSFAATILPSMSRPDKNLSDTWILHPTHASSSVPTVYMAGKPASSPRSDPTGVETSLHPVYIVTEVPSLVPSTAQNNTPSIAPDAVSSIYPTGPPTFDVALSPSGLQGENLSTAFPSGCDTYGPTLCHGATNISSYPTTNGTTDAPTEEPVKDWKSISPSPMPTNVYSGHPLSQTPSTDSTALFSTAATTVPPSAVELIMQPSLRQNPHESGSPTSQFVNGTQPSGTPTYAPRIDFSSRSSVPTSAPPSQNHSMQAPSVWPNKDEGFRPTDPEINVGSAAPSAEPAVVVSDAPSAAPSASETIEPSIRPTDREPSSFPTPWVEISTRNPIPPGPTPESTSPSMMPHSETATSQFPTRSEVPSSLRQALPSESGTKEPGTEAPTIMPSAQSEPSIVGSVFPSSVPSTRPFVMSTASPSSPDTPSQLPSNESSSVPQPTASLSSVSNPPSQTPTVFAWYKGGNASLYCSWAGKRPETRCKEMSDDGTYAYEKCEECVSHKPTVQPSQSPTLIDSGNVSWNPSSKPDVVDTDHPSFNPTASVAASEYPSTEQTSSPLSVAPTPRLQVVPLHPVPPGPTPEPTPPNVSSVPSVVYTHQPSMMPNAPVALSREPSIEPTGFAPSSVPTLEERSVRDRNPVPPGPTPGQDVHPSTGPEPVPSLAPILIPSSGSLEQPSLGPSKVPSTIPVPSTSQTYLPSYQGPTTLRSDSPSLSPQPTADPSHDEVAHWPSLSTTSPTASAPLQLSQSPTVRSWWYKRGRPSRDCTWVGSSPEKRCPDVSDDGTHAYEVCEECARFIPTSEPSPLPTFDNGVPSWKPGSEPTVGYTGPPSAVPVAAPWPTLDNWSPAPSQVPSNFAGPSLSASPTPPVASSTPSTFPQPSADEAYGRRPSEPIRDVSLRPSSSSMSPSAPSVVKKSQAPTFSPWHKAGKPSQDCSWVGQRPERRCDSKGEGGTYAYEVCLECAGFRPSQSPSQSPTEVDGSVANGKPSSQPNIGSTAQPSLPSVSPSSEPSFEKKPTFEPTSSIIGDTMLPSQAPSRNPLSLPSASPTHASPSLVPSLFPHEVSQSPSLDPTEIPTNYPSSQPSWLPTMRPWYKQGNPSFDCSWVAKRPEKRCDDKSDDGIHAYEKCEECAGVLPTSGPTQAPNIVEIGIASRKPSSEPTVLSTHHPSIMPVVASEFPSVGPTSLEPSPAPLDVGPRNPIPAGPTTVAPSANPPGIPSSLAPVLPSWLPSPLPFPAPSGGPTSPPLPLPSASPSNAPFIQLPSTFPTAASESPSHHTADIQSHSPSRSPATSPSSPSVLAPSQQSESPSSQPWYQAGNPARDCSWVAQIPESRCDDQSDDGTYAYEKCAECASFPPTPSANQIPTVLDSDVPSEKPNIKPSVPITGEPSMAPFETSTEPSIGPTLEPSPAPVTVLGVTPRTSAPLVPTSLPTWTPSENPQTLPSSSTSIEPSLPPAGQPSSAPSPHPSIIPESFPSVSPASQPGTWIPSASPHALSARPSRRLTEYPTALPTVLSWHKAGEPSKDCSWVAELPQQRCDAKSDLGIFANQTCVECVDFMPTSVPSWQPAASPPPAASSFNPTLPPIAADDNGSRVPSSEPRSPSQAPTDRPWHRQGVRSDGCGWVEGDLAGRCSTLGWNDLYAFEACPQCAALTPSAEPTQSPSFAPILGPTGKITLRPSLSKPPTATDTHTANPATQRPTTFAPHSLESTSPVLPSVAEMSPSSTSTIAPSAIPSVTETAGPTRSPSVSPSMSVTGAPAPDPTPGDPIDPFETVGPAFAPTAGPVFFASTSASPTVTPSTFTLSPSVCPTGFPSNVVPSHLPTRLPATDVLSATPTVATSPSPTQAPTSLPPTSIPTPPAPTSPPSKSHPLTSLPSTGDPSALPSIAPTNHLPTLVPTTVAPTKAPTTSSPVPIPTFVPSTEEPTITKPTSGPSTREPSPCPTLQPITRLPTAQPALTPTAEPAAAPTGEPTAKPIGKPTAKPSGGPTAMPSGEPTATPSGEPTATPSGEPTATPSGEPTATPIGQPTRVPTGQPAPVPTGGPAPVPTGGPAPVPTGGPAPVPTGEPTLAPTATPTATSSTDLRVGSTAEPTTRPTGRTTPLPTARSKFYPTLAPVVANDHPVLEPSVSLPTHSTVSVSTSIVLMGIHNAQFFKPEDEAFRASLVHKITVLNDPDDVIRITTEDFNLTTFLDGRRLRTRRFLNEDVGSIRVEHESCIKVEIGSSAQQTGGAYLNELKSIVNDGSLETAINLIGNATNLSGAVVATEASIRWIDSQSMITDKGVVSPTAAPTLVDLESPAPSVKSLHDKGPHHHNKRKKEDEDGSRNSKVKPGFMIGPFSSAILAPVCILTVALCCAVATIGIRAKAANHRERQLVEDQTIDSVNMMVATTFDSRRDAVVDISFHAIDGDGEDTYADEDILNQEDDDTGEPLDLRTCETYQVRTRHRRIEWNDERLLGRIYWVGDNASKRRFVRRFCSNNTVISALSRLELVSTECRITLKWLSPSQRLRRDLENSSNSEFVTRIAAFRHHAGNLRMHHEQGKVEFSVRRSYVFEDALAALGDMPAEHWRRPFFVSFTGEDGLDAGGLSREFFRLCSLEAFGKTAGLFQNCRGTCHLLDDDDEDLACVSQQQTRLTFVGRLIAKALIEGHLIAAHPSLIVLKHLCCEPIALDDLQLIDCELWKTLSKLPKLSPSVIDSLETPFVIDKCKQGRVVTVELCPGGASRVLNSENVSEYLELCLKERVLDVCRRGLSALLRGFYSVIPLEILLLVSGHELELVLCGTPEIDVDEWRSSTVYRGAFAELRDRHPVVKSFWRVVGSWDNRQRAVLLQWATGSSCVPCQGFAHLQGRDGAVRPFELSSVELSQAIYPRSHTCFNRIDLPLYEAESALRSAFDYVFLNAEEHAKFSLE